MHTTYKKNDIISLHIVDMAESGEGIGKIDSLVFFVKNAVVGDYVNAVVTKPTKNIIYAKHVQIKFYAKNVLTRIIKMMIF